AGGPTIELPFIAPEGSNSLSSYSLLMDIYAPDTSSGTNRVLFSNLGTQGQDGLKWTIDAQNFLHLTGAITGQPFEAVSSIAVPSNSWNRLALIIIMQDPPFVTLSMYLNGQQVSAVTQLINDESADGLAIQTNCPSCPPPPTLLSSANGQGGE